MMDKTKARRALEKQLEALEKLIDLTEAEAAKTAKAVPGKRKGRKS